MSTNTIMGKSQEYDEGGRIRAKDMPKISLLLQQFQHEYFARLSTSLLTTYPSNVNIIIDMNLSYIAYLKYQQH